jgi:hypothetical protein
VHILKVKKYLPGADVTLPKAFKFSFTYAPYQYFLHLNFMHPFN